MAGGDNDDPKATRNGVADDGDEPVVVVPATPLFQTTLRQKVTPYLPPPVVIAMKRLDPQLEPYIGPEPSINIMCSFWLALFLWQVMKLLSKVGGGGGGQAIQDDPNDSMADGGAAALLRNNTRYYDETILLCGPSLGGKTSLFYTLLGNTTNMKIKTVKSLQPNSDYLNKDQKTMMILDLPGLWDTDKVMTTIQETIKTTGSNKPMHIVVVLDSTQSVSKVADYLFKLLLSSESSNNVIIACHKSNAPKAKNVRRIKLTIRTELERLSKLQQDQDTDWDSILNEKTKLIPTSCDPPALEELWKELQA